MILLLSLSLSLSLMLLAAIASNAYGQEGLQVGEEVAFFRESPHPYNGSQESAIVWRDTIIYTDSACSFIALHFINVALFENDIIVIRNLENTRQYDFTNSMLFVDSFWCPPIPGNTIIIEIHAEYSDGEYGYEINKLTRGFTLSEIEARIETSSGICGDDNKKHAICFLHQDPVVYQKSRAVGRLWVTPSWLSGSGWLWGGNGHFMTVCHNYSNGGFNCADYSNWLDETQIEINVESSECELECNGFCVGQFISWGATEEAFSLYNAHDTTLLSLDYTLLKLKLIPTIDPEELVYLKVREGGAKLNERVYIPGYPGIRGKMISYYSDHDDDINLSEPPVNENLGYVHLHVIDGENCKSGISGLIPCGLEYYADTEKGMSGAPVISYTDHLVVGYHTQGPCPNKGNNMWPIVNDIPSNVLPPNAIGDDCYPEWDDIVITEDVTISDEVVISGNITIENGAALYVTGTLKMLENSYILVERNARLAVYDGGTITKCLYGGKWAGIRLMGNANLHQPTYNTEPTLPLLIDPDQSGELFINHGHIRLAKVAISTRNENSDFDYYGGVVYANNAFFSQNDRDIEFMPYALPNKSRFNNSIFENNQAEAHNSVWIWGNSGVVFSGCKFNNYNYEAIRAFDSHIVLRDSCIFTANERGLALESTYPMGASAIVGNLNSSRNRFLNNTYGIYASSGSGLFNTYSNNSFSLDILKNDFIGGKSAIVIDGPSNYRIGGNLFQGQEHPAFIVNTGYNTWAGFNHLRCNTFEQSNSLGSLVIGDNKHLFIVANQFDVSGSGHGDIVLTHSFYPTLLGQIADIQGDLSEFIPADNCFTPPGQQTDISTWGLTSSFHYLFREGTTITCKYEPFTVGNYEKVPMPNTTPLGDCSDVGGVPVLPENPSPSDLYDFREVITDLAPHTEGSFDTTLLYYTALEAKEALLKYYLGAAIDSADYTGAEQLLADEGSKSADWAIFGLRMNRRDFTGATTWLQNISDSSNVAQDFIDIQWINLAYLQDPASFELTPGQDSLLQYVANGTSPVRAYARSLLGLMSGQRFYTDEIDLAGERGSDQHYDLAERAPLLLYPVPAQQVLHLRWPTMPTEAVWTIDVNDSVGRLRSTQSATAAAGGHTLDVSSMNTGIYFIRIRDVKGITQYQAKFIVQR